MPIVIPPVVNVSGPVSVPAVVAVMVAFNVTLLPNANDVGLAVTVVVVAAVPWASDRHRYAGAGRPCVGGISRADK